MGNRPEEAAPLAHVEDFLQHLEHGRGVSPHTLRSYASDLRRFARHLGAGVDPSEVRTPALKAYLKELLLGGCSRATVARHAASLRAYFRYLLIEGFSSVDPAASLRTPRRPRRLPRPLDLDQVGRLLSAPTGNGFLAVRDRALLETLYSAGLRVAEAVGLDLEDVDLSEGVARVEGKGRRERIAMLGSHARRAIENYLPHRETRLRSPADKALFLNRLGTRLTDRSARRCIQRYLIKADLPSGVTPHTLRHSFATHLLERGAGLKEVQELLGHLHLSSTQIYTHLSPGHLRRIYEASHPRAGTAPEG